MAMMNKRNMMMAAAVVVVLVVLYMFLGKSDNLVSAVAYSSPTGMVSADIVGIPKASTLPGKFNWEQPGKSFKQIVKENGSGRYKAYLTPCSTKYWGKNGTSVCQTEFGASAPIHYSQRVCKPAGPFNIFNPAASSGESQYLCLSKFQEPRGLFGIQKSPMNVKAAVPFAPVRAARVPRKGVAALPGMKEMSASAAAVSRVKGDRSRVSHRKNEEVHAAFADDYKDLLKAAFSGNKQRVADLLEDMLYLNSIA